MNTSVDITPRLWLFLQESNKSEDWSFLCLRSTCGVTWVLLTYWSCARRQTSLLKMLWGSGPKEKYLTTACTTRGSLLERPCLSASSASFLWMFCLKNDHHYYQMLCCSRHLFRKERPKPQGVVGPYNRMSVLFSIILHTIRIMLNKTLNNRCAE